MPRTPATLWPALASGDFGRLARDLNPAARETDMPHRTPDSDGDFKTVAEAASPLVQRVTAAHADLLYLMLERQAREAEDTGPEDKCIGPAYPKHIRKLMRAYGHLSACPLDDHMSLARKCEELMEAAMEAADAEWRALEGGE